MASAQVAPSPAPTASAPHQWRRGEIGSARNLLHVKRRLERLIDELQHDQHDYNGDRLQAIKDMQQARAALQAAIDYDATHPGM